METSLPDRCGPTMPDQKPDRLAGDERSTLLTLLRHEDQRQVDLRWILAHLLEETARHAGHADILRELIDDSTGR